MDLRYYQSDAVDAAYTWLRCHDTNPCIVIPTGGGKTPVIATICRDAVLRWGGRVLVLAHVKELLEQTCDKLSAICPEVSYGVYSAGLRRRDTDHSVIVAGIQSVHTRACDLGPFDLVLVDEAHLIPKSGDGMYRKFLADMRVVNPHVRVIGFTATPYRTSEGVICTDDGILNAVCYEIGVRQLIADGFLSPLTSKAGKAKASFDGLHIRAGEFIAYETERLMDDDALVEAACQEIADVTKDKKGVLVFCSGIKHAEHVARELADSHGIEAGIVTGETTAVERAMLLERFKAGTLRYLVNVNVLTTGFDAPHVDCVVLLRPTMSPGLYYQMVGRGFRLSPGKDDCLVLDFGGNVLRHGPVDAINTREPAKSEGGGAGAVKECPQCNLIIAAGCRACGQCGYEFPPPKIAKHSARAGTAGVLSGEVTITEHDVVRTMYSVHRKKGAADDAPRTLRVDYQVGGIGDWVSEWICLEHEGFAGEKARKWWRDRSPDPIPTTIERAIEIADGGGLAETLGITVRTVAGEKWPRVTKYRLGPKPAPLPAPTHDDPAAAPPGTYADPYFGFDPNKIPF